MRVDPRVYIATLMASREKLMKKATQFGTSFAATEFSCYTHVPLYAVVSFLMHPDQLGPTDSLVRQMQSLIKFYGYTEVVPFD